MEGTSRSHRFFLNLDSVNPPPIDRVLFHWNDLANEKLTASQWADILAAFPILRESQNSQEQVEFGKAVLKSPAYLLALKTLPEAQDSEDIITSLSFYAHYKNKKFPNPQEELYKNLYETLHLRLQFKNLSTAQLASFIKSLDDVGYLPAKSVWNNFQKAWLSKAHQATSRESEIFYASSARLALPMKPEIIEEFKNHFTSTIPNSRLFWAAAIIDRLHKNSDLKQMVTSAYAKHGIFDIIIRNAVCAWFDIPAKEKKIKIANPKSGSESRMRNFFSIPGVRTLSEKQRRLPMLASPVDNRIVYEGKDIIIEMNGPYHSNHDFNGRPHDDGSTLLLSALKVKMSGAIVLHVNYQSHSELFNAIAPETHKDLAKIALDRIVSLEKGDYGLHFEAPNRIVIKQIENNSLIPS